MSHYCCKRCGQRYDDCRCVSYKVNHDVETRTLDVEIKILTKAIYPTQEEIEQAINEFMLEQGYLVK